MTPLTPEERKARWSGPNMTPNERAILIDRYELTMTALEAELAAVKEVLASDSDNRPAFTARASELTRLRAVAEAARKAWRSYCESWGTNGQKNMNAMHDALTALDAGQEPPNAK